MSQSQNTPYPSIMLDIETLGTAPGSIIFQIAAKTFTLPASNKEKTQTLDLHIKPSSCRRYGLTSDPATEKWWADQGLTETHAENHPNALDLPYALYILTNFIEHHTTPPAPKGEKYQALQLWSKGAFDYPLLEAAYNSISIPTPWKYYQLNDLRTVIKLANIKAPPATHEALDDVTQQINLLHQATKPTYT
jgi:hypothetical protein